MRGERRGPRAASRCLRHPRKRLFGRLASLERAFLVYMPQQPSENPQVARARAENVDLRSRLRALADESAEDRGAYVVDVQVRGQKGSRVIEVFVDSDGGLGSDDLAAISRDLGFLLETEDVVKGRYHLNVSSPGADRPLVLPRQYAKHVGRTLAVTVGEGDGATTRTGTLTAVHDDAFDLEHDGETEAIAFADVTEARVVLPW
jgi:ribosome maturation factor RimP